VNKLFIILLIITISTLKANLIYDTFDSPSNYILASNYDEKNPLNTKLAYKISFSKFYNLENVNHIDIDKIQFKMKSTKFQKEIFDHKYFRRGEPMCSPNNDSPNNDFSNKNNIIQIDKKSIFNLSFHKDTNNKLSNIKLFDLSIKMIKYNPNNEVLTIILNKKISLENKNYWLVFSLDSPLNHKNLYHFGVNNLSGFDNNLLFTNPGLKFKTDDKFHIIEDYNNLNIRFYGTVKFKDMSKLDFKTKIDVYEDYTLLSINLEKDNNTIKVDLFDYKGMFVKALFKNQISKGISYFFVSNKDLPEYEYFFKVSLDDENFVKSFKITHSFIDGNSSVGEIPVARPNKKIIENKNKSKKITTNETINPPKINYKFLFPGLYQFEESKTKSFLLSVSFSTTFIFSIINLNNHYNTMDSYNNLLKSYHQDPNPSTRDELQTLLNDANSFHNKFTFFSITSALIYSYNIFEYLYLNPVRVNPSIRPSFNLNNKTIGLQLKINFWPLPCSSVLSVVKYFDLAKRKICVIREICGQRHLT